MSPRGGIRSIKSRTYRSCQILITEENLFPIGKHDLLAHLYIKGIPVDPCSNPTAFPSTTLQVFVSMMLWLALFLEYAEQKEVED